MLLRLDSKLEFRSWRLHHYSAADNRLTVLSKRESVSDELGNRIENSVSGEQSASDLYLVLIGVRFIDAPFLWKDAAVDPHIQRHTDGSDTACSVRILCGEASYRIDCRAARLYATEALPKSEPGSLAHWPSAQCAMKLSEASTVLNQFRSGLFKLTRVSPSLSSCAFQFLGEDLRVAELVFAGTRFLQISTQIELSRLHLAGRSEAERIRTRAQGGLSSSISDENFLVVEGLFGPYAIVASFVGLRWQSDAVDEAPYNGPLWDGGPSLTAL